MKTRRTENGFLVIDGGPMDGVLIHESNISAQDRINKAGKIK